MRTMDKGWVLTGEWQREKDGSVISPLPHNLWSADCSTASVAVDDVCGWWSVIYTSGMGVFRLTTSVGPCLLSTYWRGCSYFFILTIFINLLLTLMIGFLFLYNML